MTHELMRPSAALAAYAETLVEGRRALVLCDSSSDIPELLLDRGARLVQVCDADQARLSEAATRNASRNITFTALPDKTLPVRDGSFDVAIVENLATLASPAHILEKLRRALTPQGVALIASPNDDAKARLLPDADQHRSETPSYYEFYDLVAEHFEEVAMFGQTPFVGYALASFAPDGEPVPALDTGLVPGGAEEPEWFVAMASLRAIELEDFAVIQLPFRGTLPQAASPDVGEEIRAAKAAEQKSRERMAEVETELTRLREEARAKPTETESDGRLQQLETELNRREAWIAQLESRAAAADARADEMEVELSRVRTRDRKPEKSEAEEQLQSKLGAAVRRAGELEAELAGARSKNERAARLEKELGRGKHRITELEGLLETRSKKLEAELSALTDAGELGDEDPNAEEIARLEALLVSRADEIQMLEQQLRAAERIGKELVLEVEELRAPTSDDSPASEPASPDADLDTKIEHLARVNAEREADLEAARWSIEELETRLANAAEAGVARELDQARAEVQRQAVLIEQLEGRATSERAR